MRTVDFAVTIFLSLLGLLLLITAINVIDGAPVDEPKPIQTVNASTSDNLKPLFDTTLKLHGTCECAVFSTEEVTENDTPILSRGPFDIMCNHFDKEYCLQLCIALAQQHSKDGAALLCANLKQYDRLKASIHGRLNTQKWTYSGLTVPKEICCQDSKVVECDGAANLT